MWIIDGHLDLAMNAMDFNRDLRKDLPAINLREKGMDDFPGRGQAMVSFPELKKGRIGLCFATVLARYVKPGNPIPGWHSPQQAWAHIQGQLAWYAEMEREGWLKKISNLSQLNHHVAAWDRSPENQPLGYLLTLEGADSILSPAHLHQLYDQGLRAIGLSHYGPGTYAQGTDATGGISPKGILLLKELEKNGWILDLTHLTDVGFDQALDRYQGPVWSSHSNCRALASGQRQWSDAQIYRLIDREAILGVAIHGWMLMDGWVKDLDTVESMNLTLAQVVAHIDHICQLAGNADHVAIGSDLDGGFGRDQCPREMETIADLPTLAGCLREKGYEEAAIQKILHGNWLRFLQTHLPPAP